MLFDLKAQELMHSFQSLGVRSADEHFAATIRLDILVRKVALHPLHFGNTGPSLSMRHHRTREIPLRKSLGYSLQVLADLIPRGRIGWVIRLNFDGTTGRSELEMVGCLDLAGAHAIAPVWPNVPSPQTSPRKNKLDPGIGSRV